jgi:hypothetical protein
MSKFKIGDKIKCVSKSVYVSENYPTPIVGQIYTVEANHVIGEVTIKESVGGNECELSRTFELEIFELVQEADLLCSTVPTKTPRVTKNENIVYFDVDETLVKWVKSPGEAYIVANYFGERVNLAQHEPHVRFLKSLKERGFYIIVHSGNGWAWAKQVVELLNLNEFVDEIKSKPSKVVDDTPYENWMPPRIYIQE